MSLCLDDRSSLSIGMVNNMTFEYMEIIHDGDSHLIMLSDYVDTNLFRENFLRKIDITLLHIRYLFLYHILSYF